LFTFQQTGALHATLEGLSPARKLAFQILRLVEKGAHSSDLLHTRGAALEARDAALATELVQGCIRRRAQLDWLIQCYSGREKFDLEVRIALWLGIYQLRYLDRVPAHAAVGESVQLVRFGQKTSAAGLVNAVLRKVDREPVDWPTPAMRHCLPEWLFEKWLHDFGEERAGLIASASLIPPETYVRVPVSLSPAAARKDLEPTDVSGCYRALGPNTGGFRIQDIGSQSVVPLLDLEPGMSFLDLCAAPGGKTAQALESGVIATACDLYFSRLRALARLKCRKVVLDATKSLPLRTKFDRILVDAPCSGTGTLRRNPEIRWRVHPEDLARLAARQVAILTNALAVLEPRGRLAYSTCSLEPEENEEVVRQVLQQCGGRLRLAKELRRTPGEQPGDGFYAAVITSE
jgi:16S rRNA (cytosine967-C5)-methyltransferase